MFFGSCWLLSEDFFKITNPQWKIIEKKMKFVFDDVCLKALKFLKEWLIFSPIIVSPVITILGYVRYGWSILGFCPWTKA